MLPTDRGTYVLLLRCSSSRTVRVGRLGSVRLRPGYYLYVGSAFGPGGLRARIDHHRHGPVRLHWHIDHLRRYTHLDCAWYRCGERCEHDWAARIGNLPGAATVILGFGSSDCQCDTHLFWIEVPPPVRALSPDGGTAAAIIEL